MQEIITLRRRIRIRSLVTYALIAAVIIIYTTLMPSAVFHYEYRSLEEIEDDLSPATRKQTEAKLCPLVPPHLDSSAFGNFFTPSEDYLQSVIVFNNHTVSEFELGGRWRPKWCTSQHRVAIVVPYRNRDHQLKMFLAHMHYFLRKQLVDYTIIVVEQGGSLAFNRGALFNVGFLEGLKLYPDLHCFIFHDVDLLPMNEANIYACSKMPRHMSVSINTFRFNLPYVSIFGGVVAITAEQFRAINGFSNRFFGWGGEDDDMLNRILNGGYEITRWSPRISRYYMLFHAKEVPNVGRFRLLREGMDRFNVDGLQNMVYSVINMERQTFCTFISVDF